MQAALRITETEWQVMRVIWARHPVTAAEVIAQLTRQDPKWHPKTVRTFLARLVNKRVLDAKTEGRRYRYKPRVSEEACAAVVAESLLDRVFDGSLRPMLAHFVRQRKLPPEEIAALKRILDGEEE